MSVTDLFAEIEGVIGFAAAFKLAEARGGQRTSLPARAPDGHWLVTLLGREAADKLCAHFRESGPDGAPRGRVLDLPRGPAGTLAQAQRRMADALAAGDSADIAARKAGLTRRTAFRMRKRGQPDPRQGRLF